MKKPTTLFFMCFLFSIAIFAQERNCSTMENLEYRKQQDPGLELRMAQIEAFTQTQIQQMENNRIDGSIITLPVVVHVLYRNSTENISVAQIQSQLDVLNEDFRRTNPDADNTWSQAADTQIEFCLASIDPNGNATSGITRKSTTRQDWGTTDDMKKSSQGGVNPWNTSEYLNMWIVPKMTSGGNTILGYAQFPGGNAATDGVVMAYNYFGRVGNVSAPFDGGRTTTHEVGHYLNLRHIWGDANCGNDFVSDTPTHQTSNGGCPTGRVSCGSADMVQNYMDYTNDSCMNLFTAGQKNRMRAVLNAGGARRSLALSEKCGGSATTPTCNDGVQNGTETGVDCGGSSCQPCQTGSQYCSAQGNSVNDEYISRVQLGTINKASGAQSYSDFTATSTNLTKANNYTVTVTPTWTGTSYNEGYAVWIDYNQDGDFTDSGEQVWSRSASKTSPVSGSFTIPTSATLGETRMRVAMKYNAIPTSCETFSYGEVEDYTVNIVSGGNSGGDTTVSLSITFDNYPEETSWAILDGGTTVASGGTYGSQPDGSTLNIDVNLPAGCYALVVRDVYGDGICCSYGNGSYTLKAGTTTLASGGSFTSSQTTNFCVGGASRGLGTVTSSTDDLFTLYPNPTKQALNIALNGLEAQSYQISNMLGQIVMKGVFTETINVSELNDGMYIIQLNIGEKTKVKRFIKQ
ncbi:GEVED domain-containing protein [Bizionia sp. M204]|uniref:GEVED domain-containing protein n=1 Tax=Bizionia sp. M204 TaxID=2675331 RepID=UPI002065DF19|nr:GEVED domain-containing protein [Bizionia sp. M204]UPS92476.1 T9SS type A sorting domain-containing protein [Bizionia sp. M204]